MGLTFLYSEKYVAITGYMAFVHTYVFLYTESYNT
jgi:hypothetical protein